MYTKIETIHRPSGQNEPVRTEHLVNLDKCHTVTKDKDPTKLAFVGTDGNAIVANYASEDERNEEFRRLSEILTEPPYET